MLSCLGTNGNRESVHLFGMTHWKNSFESGVCLFCWICRYVTEEFRGLTISACLFYTFFLKKVFSRLLKLVHYSPGFAPTSRSSSCQPMASPATRVLSWKLLQKRIPNWGRLGERVSGENRVNMSLRYLSGVLRLYYVLIRTEFHEFGHLSIIFRMLHIWAMHFAVCRSR